MLSKCLGSSYVFENHKMVCSDISATMNLQTQKLCSAAIVSGKTVLVTFLVPHLVGGDFYNPPFCTTIVYTFIDLLPSFQSCSVGE